MTGTSVRPRVVAWTGAAAVRLAGSSGLFRLLRFVLNGRFAPRIWNRLVPHISGRVLDIGCGTGELAHFIRTPYIGIDFDVRFLRAARRQIHDGWVLAADARRMPFKDRSFGTALLVQALHHLSDDEAAAILAEAARAAGRVVVVDAILPARPGLRRFLHDVDRGKFMRGWRAQERLLTALGFVIVHAERFWGPTRMYEFSLFVCGEKR